MLAVTSPVARFNKESTGAHFGVRGSVWCLMMTRFDEDWLLWMYFDGLDGWVDYLYKLWPNGSQIGARKRTVLMIRGGHKGDERRCDVSIARALDLHDQNYTLTREQCKSFSYCSPTVPKIIAFAMKENVMNRRGVFCVS